MDSQIISQPPVRTFSVILQGTPAGYGQTNITNAAVGLPSLPTGANKAIVQIETGDSVRWRDDGVAPTASVGNLLYPANLIVLENAQSISQFQVIGVTGGGVTLNVNYYVR